ncbi:MAG: hypothetical protein ABFR89_02580 [Actinomycetota bacterium]
MSSQVIPTGRCYTEAELAWGRRPVSVVSPTPLDIEARIGRQSVRPADESFDEPLFRLPEGWVDMSVQEISDWATVEAARLGRIAGLGRVDYEDMVGHNDCPNDRQWSDPGVRSRATCRLCGGTIEEAPCNESGWECDGCGAGNGDVMQELAYVAPGAADRWLGTGPKGSMGLYTDAERSAALVTYHEDEPVVPEQPAVTTHTYPAGWDRPIGDVDGADGGRPGRSVAERRRHLVEWARFRALRPRHILTV